ncbi:MAG: hypothetical protein WCK02_02095 [Bacteroidota bacterium]
MRIFIINNTQFSIPQEWNEIPDATLLFIAELIQQEITKQEFLIKIFLFNAKLKIAQIKSKHIVLSKGKEKYYLTACLLNALSKAYLFLLREQNADDECICELSNNRTTPISVLDIKGIKYYSPSDSLTNITLHEYIFAETYYHKYAITGKVEYLDMLIATLYRPKSRECKTFLCDIREPFNDFIISKRAKEINRLNFNIKIAIKWFYEGSCSYIQTKFPEVFKPAPLGKKQDVFEGFMKLVNVLANNDLTKNELVRNANLYEALITLNELMIKPKVK